MALKAKRRHLTSCLDSRTYPGKNRHWSGGSGSLVSPRIRRDKAFASTQGYLDQAFERPVDTKSKASSITGLRTNPNRQGKAVVP
jgi:hypothetical protein